MAFGLFELFELFLGDRTREHINLEERETGNSLSKTTWQIYSVRITGLLSL